MVHLAVASILFTSSFAYEFVATTTRYGDTPMSSCGSVDTRALVAGTGYHSVASAQSMQSVFSGGHTCTWRCSSGSYCQWTGGGHGGDGHPTGGCTCRQDGDCMCGKGQGGSGTASLGCFSCGKGRFIKKTPYSSDDVDVTDYASPEIHVVVADICPYGSNAQWCPGRPGDVNACGQKNHLDFSDPPAGINNNYFVFSPAPCSATIISRARSMMKHPCQNILDQLDGLNATVQV
eukprot:TRINITY_DN76651_c0_g1_i1.p1 TRINITY_DN76651_c0_g1~~TRINITY_DN76651_c0_g1_i1.p1  ORF type:complete len:234 (-),score=15.28 TRINITY_DN76651_c0_g1_i1:125-826(-)